MISNALAATRLEIVSGEAIVEVDELLEGNAVTVKLGDAQIALVKKGLYRFDAEPARLRVYDGEARATANGETASAKKGRQLEIGAVLAASSFNTKDNDAFARWSARRAEYLATANIASARSSLVSQSNTGSWVWNQWYGMFTYLPGYAYGFGYSPYGWAWYNPVTVYVVSVPHMPSPTQIPSPIRASLPTRGSDSVGFTATPNRDVRSYGPSPSVVNSGGMTAARGGFDGGGYNGGGISGGGGGGVSAPVSAPAPSVSHAPAGGARTSSQ